VIRRSLGLLRRHAAKALCRHAFYVIDKMSTDPIANSQSKCSFILIKSSTSIRWLIAGTPSQRQSHQTVSPEACNPTNNNHKKLVIGKFEFMVIFRRNWNKKFPIYSFICFVRMLRGDKWSSTREDSVVTQSVRTALTTTCALRMSTIEQTHIFCA
jgi:hypothetical protein